MARDRQTSLRLEGALLEKLQKAARDNRRTLAAEISLRLEQSFEPHEPNVVLRQIAEASKVLAEAGAKLSGGSTLADQVMRAVRSQSGTVNLSEVMKEHRRLSEQLNELEAAERILRAKEKT